MKNSKKLMAIIAAGTLIIGSTAGVFAADQTTNDFDTAATATYSANTVQSASLDADSVVTTPTICVEVPTASGFIINPYKLEASIKTEKSKNQIISVKQLVTNKSDVMIGISAAATGTPDGSATLATASAVKQTTNSVYLYLDQEVQSSDGAKSFTTTATAAPKEITKSTLGAYAATTDVLISSSEKKSATMYLPAKDATTYALAFQFSGDAATNPITPWTAADTVNVDLTYTFAPIANVITP